MIDPFWNLAHRLYLKGFRRLARFFEVLSMTISSHAVSAQIEIGEGSRFWHHGLGCVALQTVHIGKNCMIFQNVTFGNTLSERSSQQNRGGYCSVGDNVMIGAGAVILGNIRIGSNVQIGANAVVTHDIPDNCVAVGIPARFKVKNNSEE